MNLNKKGFTLVEMLAVVVILSVLMAIMVPSVNHLIKEHQENLSEELKKSMLSAAKIHLSDNRYEVGIEGTCNNETETKAITSIRGETLATKSQLSIKQLIETGNIKTTKDKNGNEVITNPLNSAQTLNLDSSYVKVEYSCQKKDFIYSEVQLIWE